MTRSSRPTPAAPRARRRVVAALGACLLVSCSPPAGRDGQPPDAAGVSPGVGSAPGRARGNHLVIGLQQEPDKLNSALNAMVYGTYINQTLYGYFVKYDDQMVLQPMVIAEIPTLDNGGIQPDGLTYTYHLRPGLRWHDGHPFTSADVKFSAEAILDERHEVESRIGFDKVASIDTPDDLTVVFHLKEPYVRFVEDTFFEEGLMPRHLLADKVGPDFTAAPYHRAPVGLGPFKFQEWVTGSHVTVVRNQDYFEGVPAVESITFRFIPDSNALLVSLRAGEIDGYDNAGTDQVPQLKTMDWITANVTPLLMWEHVDSMVENPILKDVRVRQAIQLAIDREQVSREVYAGLWPPAYGFVSPRLPWYNPKVKDIVRHDPEASRRLLEEAGWTLGKDGIRVRDGKPLSFSISTTAGRRQRELTEQVLQQHLRDVGIELKVENHNATAFFAPFEQNGVLKRGRFDLAMFAWISSPDPDKYTLYHSVQVPPGGQNHSRHRHPRLDQLLEEGLRALDPVQRKAIYDEIQVLVAEEAATTPLVWRADIDPMTKRLENFRPNPTQTGDTWNAWQWRLAPDRS